MSIRTMLFDLDGTLLNTNELIYTSFEHTFEKFNYSFTREEIKSFNGPPLIETFHQIDPDKAMEMVKTYREYNLLHHDEYVTIFPDVLKTLEKLEKSNIQMAIVTNKVKYVVDLGLEQTGLNKFFSPDRVITIDDVKHPKPHPEAVIKAMETFQSNGESTLMVGDNYHDIKAGQHAGVKTAGVSWSEKGRAFLEKYQPTYMIDHMSDLLRFI